jgi:hypothetical protein
MTVTGYERVAALELTRLDLALRDWFHRSPAGRAVKQAVVSRTAGRCQDCGCVTVTHARMTPDRRVWMIRPNWSPDMAPCPCSGVIAANAAGFGILCLHCYQAHRQRPDGRGRW